jgi:SAM-dependent methyltransferase
MSEDHFDEAVAATYDDAIASELDQAMLEQTVDFLVEQVRGGEALELGIGTGRVALPLAERGVSVRGIDLSAAMVERLRAKPGGADIEVVLGDFARAKVDGSFRLAYLVFNTITNLTSQDEQVACFTNVADHLEPGGRFVVEVFVPILQRLPPGESTRIFHRDAHGLSVDEYDVATQQMYSHHYTFDGDTYRRTSIPFRYVWPAELDLMARIAGLQLVERWGNWSRTPFTAESSYHVSVWEKP